MAHKILVSAQGPLVFGIWVWGLGVWGLGLTIIYILRWLEVITDWLQYSTDVYCIYYEVTSKL